MHGEYSPNDVNYTGAPKWFVYKQVSCQAWVILYIILFFASFWHIYKTVFYMISIKHLLFSGKKAK